MKPLVIYHANCTDGFGAAFAAWLKLGDEAEYLPMQYGQGINWGTDSDGFLSVDGKPQREVYILDFIFPREVMEQIFALAKRVVWLDHHKTAFEMWCPAERELCVEAFGDMAQNTVILDNNRSGALIAWEYFHPGTEVPMLIQHIDDRDRWQFKMYGSKELHATLRSYEPWTFEQWNQLLNDGETYWKLRDEGVALLRAHNQNVQSVVKSAAMSCALQWDWKPVAGTVGYREEKGLAANCPPHLSSDVGHELATQSGTFGLLWNMDKDGKVKCSLRSNGGYDVSAIAKAFGGGGHRNAAGFETDIDTLMGWLK